MDTKTAVAAAAVCFAAALVVGVVIRAGISRQPRRPAEPPVMTDAPIAQQDAGANNKPAEPAPWPGASDHLPPMITGTVITIRSADIITFARSDARAGSPPATLLLSKDAAITLDGAPAHASDIKPEMDLRFPAAQSDQAVTKAEFFTLLADGQPHRKSGPIEKVDAGAVDFLAGRRDLFPCTAIIGPQTTVTIDGDPKSVSDLRRRMFVTVEYIDARATSITAQTVMHDGKPHHVQGQLTSYSPDQLVIRAYGAVGFDVKLRPADTMKVLRATSPATAADLQPGQTVIATYTDGLAADITINPAASPARPAATLP